jgi:hypothetical protein
MSNWIATNELRFVVRDVSNDSTFNWDKKILQQKWELNDPKFMYQSEWRDVPVVEEE